jgi:hypothetical protein
MDQFDLFAAPPLAAKPYQPLKAFAFPSNEWRGPPLFTSVCLRHGDTHNGTFRPRRRSLLGFSAHFPTRRAYALSA